MCPRKEVTPPRFPFREGRLVGPNNNKGGTQAGRARIYTARSVGCVQKRRGSQRAFSTHRFEIPRSYRSPPSSSLHCVARHPAHGVSGSVRGRERTYRRKKGGGGEGRRGVWKRRALVE